MAPDRTEPGAPPAQRRTRRTILVGVDGSRNATRAFDSALIIAGIRHLEILLVGAFTYPFAYLDPYDPAVADERATYLGEVEERIRQAAAPLLARAEEAGIPARLEICEGDAAGALMRASADAEIGVVGKRGRTPFGGRFMGSVSNSFVSHSRCPVLVVPEAWDGDPGTVVNAPPVEGAADREPVTAELRIVSRTAEIPVRTDDPEAEESPTEEAEGTEPPADPGEGAPALDVGGAVVLAVDPGNSSGRIAPLAADWAVAVGRPLVLISALALGVESESWVPNRIQRPLLDAPRVHGAAIGRLKEITAALAESHPGLDVEWRFYDGIPAEVIGEATRTASIVVVGSRGRGGFTGLLLGSVSRAVLTRAVCPVLVVPTRHT